MQLDERKGAVIPCKVSIWMKIEWQIEPYNTTTCQ